MRTSACPTTTATAATTTTTTTTTKTTTTTTMIPCQSVAASTSSLPLSPSLSLSLPLSPPPLSLLVSAQINVFRRCHEARARKSRDAPAELDEVFAYISELCISYAAIALLNPSMFPQPPDVEAKGVLRLLAPLKRDGPGGLPSGFLNRLTLRLEEEGALGEFAEPLCGALAAEVKSLTILGDFSPACRALFALFREKPLAAAVAKSEAFVPAAGSSGAALESSTILGPFLGLSCFPVVAPGIARECFDSFHGAHVENSMVSLRLSLQHLQGALRAIATELLKNTEAKEPFFSLCAAACSRNEERLKTWFMETELSRLLHALDPRVHENPQASLASLSKSHTHLVQVSHKSHAHLSHVSHFPFVLLTTQFFFSISQADADRCRGRRLHAQSRLCAPRPLRAAHHSRVYARL